MKQPIKREANSAFTLPVIEDAYGKAQVPAEYMLVITPHEDLREKIIEIKKTFANSYSCEQAMHIKPQMLLAKFTQFEMMEQRIINRLKNICSGLADFKVDIDNFGSYPSHTIYLKVTSQVKITELQKLLKKSQSLMTINKENKPFFAEQPCIIIANKLLPWQYEKSWTAMQHSHFSASFIVNDIVLLKRKMHNQGYTILTRFALQNEPVVVKQCSMF